MQKAIGQAGLLLLLSILAIVEGMAIIKEYSTTYGASLAGWYVIALGATLGCLTIIYFVRNWEAAKSLNGVLAAPTAEAKAQMRKLRLLILLLVCYFLVIEYLGYTLSTVLFLGVYLRCLGEYNWGKVLLISVPFGVAFGLIFYYVGMVLPAGFLPFP